MHYLRVCQDGTFYEELAGLWKIDLDAPGQRNRMKRRCFTFFFGETRPDNGRWKAFKARWPVVAWFMERIKADDYRNAVRYAQRMESTLMITGVVGRLMAEYPGIPLITIHDAVLTLPRHAETVRSAILAEFGAGGAVPTIRVKETA